MLPQKPRVVIARVVVPQGNPVAILGLARQGRAAIGLGQVKADRQRLGLIVALRRQPAPGRSRCRADTGHQSRRPAQALAGLAEQLLLRVAVARDEGQLQQAQIADFGKAA